MIAIISEMFLRSMWFRSGDDDNKGNAIFLIIGLVLAILAPLVVQLVQLAISRKREFAADACAVKFTRYPPGLIGALSKIKNDSPMKVSQAVSPLFMSDPFRRKVAGLFSTHPAIDERISVLKKM
jgi:heat shock protein HtpX